MTDIRKVIKKIRQIPPKPIEVVEDDVIRLAEARGFDKMDALYRSQVEITRQRNFEKAQQALQAKRDEKRAEEERQEEIMRVRLKNLKKARKARYEQAQSE